MISLASFTKTKLQLPSNYPSVFFDFETVQVSKAHTVKNLEKLEVVPCLKHSEEDAGRAGILFLYRIFQFF